MTESSLNVAVVGAGVAGLITARELLRENHRVVVFEKSEQVGGTWVYDPQFEDDDRLFSHDGRNRGDRVHSSLYSSLRTNLPRPLMGFSDFSLEDKVYDDPRLFPGHQEVLKFIQDFAENFGLIELIRFNSEVVRVERVDSEKTEFLVEWKKKKKTTRTSGMSSESEVFDAVVVCNGHDTEPHIATDIPGIGKWSRKQVHSHNYRVPEPFQNQVVVMIGSGPSAVDLSREVATVAKEVHLSSRSPNVKASKLEGHVNIWQHLEIDSVSEDKVVFKDGFSVEADVIFHCTGYKFYFPFLRTNGIVSVEDNRVGPLYKHVFPPRLAPRLSFVGVTTTQGLLFRMLELQTKWIAQALSRKKSLPSESEMSADVAEHYRQMEETGIPKHHTHSLRFQYEYVDWLADQVGSPVEDRLKHICTNLISSFYSNPDGIRESFRIEN